MSVTYHVLSIFNVLIAFNRDVLIKLKHTTLNPFRFALTVPLQSGRTAVNISAIRSSTSLVHRALFFMQNI